MAGGYPAPYCTATVLDAPPVREHFSVTGAGVKCQFVLLQRRQGTPRGIYEARLGRRYSETLEVCPLSLVILPETKNVACSRLLPFEFEHSASEHSSLSAALRVRCRARVFDRLVSLPRGLRAPLMFSSLMRSHYLTRTYHTGTWFSNGTSDPL